MTRSRLVKDNKLNRDMLSRRPIRRGYEVGIAQDKREGFRPAGSHMPDIILLDLSLARNGRVGAISPHEGESSKMKTIRCRGSNSARAGCRRALEAGFDEYNIKPVEMPRLLKKNGIWEDRDKFVIPNRPFR